MLSVSVVIYLVFYQNMKRSRSSISEIRVYSLVEQDDSFSDNSSVDNFRDISSYDGTDIDADYDPVRSNVLHFGALVNIG